MTRAQQLERAAEIKKVLRGAHFARNANSTMRAMADLAPVPAIRSLETEPDLVILAYALLVDDLIQQNNLAPHQSMIRAATDPSGTGVQET